tara:strand:+ start:327 stop:689 length:363 start_codon:yes stop_codon:yes gene_type:complete
MPTITLTFAAPLNVSCQVGDTAYTVPTSTTAGFKVNSQPVTEIGTITRIQNPLSSTPVVTVDTSLPGTYHSVNNFVFFSKDNKANLSSILGYYADVKFRNNSTAEAEIFSIGADTFESSK